MELVNKMEMVFISFPAQVIFIHYTARIATAIRGL